MEEFLAGVATCGSWGIAAFFLRFWMDTRDRFFALFLSAVLVRVTLDGWLLPGMASWMVRFCTERELYSRRKESVCALVHDTGIGETA